MPMKLNVGVSRKVGLPEYSSAGASCNVELELDSGLLQHDVNAFQAQVQAAFSAAEAAVEAEVARLQEPAAPPNGLARWDNRNGGAHHTNGTSRPAHVNGTHARPTGVGRNGSSSDRATIRCTAKQARAIRAIARNLNLDLEQMLREDFGVGAPDDLTLSQASELIDSLRASREA